MKTQHFANIWKAASAPFAPSNYAPGNYKICYQLVEGSGSNPDSWDGF